MSVSGVDPNIMAKVRKLFALGAEGSGGTEAERNLAMERAQKLMLKYNLDLEAIETQGEGSVKGDVAQNQSGLQTNRRSDWEGRLLNTIAHYNLCRVYYVASGRGNTKRKVWFVVGRNHNIAFVQELHQFVVDQLKAECRMALSKARGTGATRNPNSFRRSFYEGAELSIGSRLADQQRARMVESGSKGQELVRSETADIDSFLHDLFGDNMAAARQRRGSKNVAGQMAGRDAGRRTDLFPGRKLGSGS